ncbi:MAG: type II toxin-antitoxin system RelE/ParE family toxin [Ignavibacteriales bacterium]|nr:type II toxin-antitoxin system RelE/ParE family toxin [Ignavibacteriales bacterium]
MKILLTEPAKFYLKEIYQYYNETISNRVAHQIKNSIFNKIKFLRSFPEMGQVESRLEYLQREHRYLVEGNYKVIYYIAEQTIYITDIFDTRQDPEELISRNT